MKLVEYQGKNLFCAHGIPIPAGRTVSSAQKAKEAFAAFPDGCVLKIQVPAGKRGRGGGIALVNTAAEAEKWAARFLGTTFKDFRVDEILVEERLSIEKELYLGLIIDTNSGEIVLLFSQEGGMDIEEVADKKPEQLFRLRIQPLSPPPSYRLKAFLRQGGFQRKKLLQLTDLVSRFLTLYLETDLLMAEINPLVILEDGSIVAGDAKVEVDDNALFRQKFQGKFWEEKDPLEKKAREIGVSYVKLEGKVGVIASGAGLGMTTMDLLEEEGFPPANFLETGGGITEDLMYKATHLVLNHKNVEGILINLYGGVNPIEKGAQGIVRALEERDKRPAVVVKALGNKQEECWAILEDRGIPVVKSVRTENAVNRLVEILRADQSLADGVKIK